MCLSGGLDSTGIAVLVREHFRNAVAVSFDLQRPGGRVSEDRRVAERLARDLDLPLLEADATEDQLFELLDTVLTGGNRLEGLQRPHRPGERGPCPGDRWCDDGSSGLLCSPVTWQTSSWPTTNPSNTGTPLIIVSQDSRRPPYETAWYVVSIPAIGK